MSKVTRAQKKNAVRYGSERRVREALDKLPDETRNQILDDIVENDYSFFVDKIGNLIRTETPYSNHDME